MRKSYFVVIFFLVLIALMSCDESYVTINQDRLVPDKKKFIDDNLLTKKKYNDWFSDYVLSSDPANTYISYEDLETKLRSLGIKGDNKVLFAFDNYFCNQMYLSNQLDYSFDKSISSTDLKKLVSNPKYKYLVVNDTILFNKIYGKDLKEKIISSHRSLLIYKLFN